MHLCVPARLAEFDGVRRAINEFASRSDICSEDCHRLVLMAEELFLNTVRHGYGGECDRPVTISLHCNAAALELRFEDEAPAFDPIARPRVSTLGADPDTRPLGGLGILLTLALGREARYRREDQRNVIELTFVRSPG
jgi:anti-sigma regulatory factor (Ser/Thr protein kinase)